MSIEVHEEGMGVEEELVPNLSWSHLGPLELDPTLDLIELGLILV